MRERTKFPRSVLSQLPNLRLLTTTGMKNAGIDLRAAEELGIVVSGTATGEHSASGTVEQTWALILALARRIVPGHESVRNRAGWQEGVATGLQGKRLGLVGLGRLGTQVAKVGIALGMKVVAWSPHLDEKRASEAGVKYVGLEELMTTSDVVSVHIVLAKATEGIIGAQELGWMKKDAFLVNTSRGPLVNKEALVKALTEGKIKGAGLDTFDVEPLPLDDPFRTLDNVVLSPHMGASSPLFVLPESTLVA